MAKALFLDRDGIINIDHGYVYKISDFYFNDDIFTLCQVAQQLNYKIIVITNQSGIARGYYQEEDFKQLTQWMQAEFTQQGVHIDDVFYCPHHSEYGINEYKQNCNCRKPKPGMLLSAQGKHQLSMSESIFIGDKLSDMQASTSAGIGHNLLVSHTDVVLNPFDGQIQRLDNLAAALKYIEQLHGQ